MLEKTKLKIAKVRHPKTRIKVRFLVASGLILAGTMTPITVSKVDAESCPDLMVVFVRGSGEERWDNENYQEFKKQVQTKLPSSGITYDFLDLDYPAIGVGLDKIDTALGAFFGAGDAYDFGDSVNKGVEELKRVVNESCTKTKYVLGGYSQGAMVISKSLSALNSDKVIYAATFGDPKIYLPEGAGLVPVACAGRNLSNYRIYVPDCRAYEGLLGSYRPYQPEQFLEKLGTWCNKYDVMCSSHFDIGSHTSYVSDDLYEDASRVIASKVSAAFNIKNEYSSPHDTVILIDSTGSMEWMIDQFKEEANRLANETFTAGGRVALYDYRDLDDPYEPVARCTFEVCTPENFAEYLDEILIGSGGDEPESLLSASLNVMNKLKWRRGATKSMVVLTDAPFLDPDRDETTMQDVVDLSKQIDPVNIYVVTDSNTAEAYPEMNELASATGGMVFTDFGSLSLLTNQIMARYDTLPRVEETLADLGELPKLEVTEVLDKGEKVEVKYHNTGNRTIVILNDAILGTVEGSSVVIDGLDRGRENELVLVPINESRRGEKVAIKLPVMSDSEILGFSDDSGETSGISEGSNESEDSDASGVSNTSGASDIPGTSEKGSKRTNVLLVPKVPDTGMASEDKSLR